MRGPDIRLSKAPVSEPARAFAYALGAVYHVAQGFTADAPEGEPEPGLNRHILSKSWGVEGREDLIRRLTDLGSEGHRERYGKLLRYYAMLWRPNVASLREQCRSDIREGGEEAEDSAALLWRLDAVQADKSGIRSSPLLAFDAARGIMLARAGLMLGWLSEDEAWDYMLDVARDVQRTYGSWAAYGKDFLLSRNVWAGDDTPDVFDAVVSDLLEAPKSPWRRIPWGEPSLTVPRPLRPVDASAPVWTLERA